MILKTTLVRSSRTSPGPAILLALVAAVGLLGGPARGQYPPAQIPPFHLLMDDMILPEDVVRGDAVFYGTPWSNGIVPYTFDANVTAANRAVALTGMAEWAAVADLSFVPRTTHPNWIRFITVTGGNSSQVGMAGGQQNINITNWNWRTLLHELGHALGYLHEQQRPDRDGYVQINWQNISQTACGGNPCDGNFNIVSGATMLIPYDFDSCMHYRRDAFSANGQDTITVLPPYQGWQGLIGQGNHMSIVDGMGMTWRYGAPPPPAIQTISPESAIAIPGGGALTLVVQGNRFHRGRGDNTGVEGSIVRVDGIAVPTTYVSPTELTATVPAALLAVGCRSVEVENPAPGGGLSDAVHFPVVPASFGPSWVGRQPDEQFGYAVTGAGDLDGDGRSDVAVGIPGYAGDAGRVQARSGDSGAIIWTRDGSANLRFGESVALVGDVNGDGLPDVIAGGPGYSSDRGLARLLSGADGTAIHTWFGDISGDRFGSAVAGAGDVNGDGIPDVVIGIPGYSSDLGRIQVYDGATHALIRGRSGEVSGDRFGSAVAGGFDMDNDGIPDVLVGAPHAGANAGRAYLYSGADGVQIFVKNGGASGDGFGTSVALLPSYIGNSKGDAAVGAPGADGAGPIPLLSRGTVRVFAPVAPLGYPSVVTYLGKSAGDRLGRSVASAGDVDQDGIADLAIGADQLGILGSPGRGYFQVFSERTRTLIYEREGAAPGDAFGRSVAGAGDANGDGTPDIVAGAPSSDIPCTNAGSGRVIFSPVPPALDKLMITEITWGEPDGVELTNFSDGPINLTDWKVLWKDGTIRTAALAGSIASGQTIVVKEPGGILPETPPGTQILSSFPSIPTNSSDFTVALVNDSGLVVDEARVASSTGSYAEGSLGGGFRGLVLRPDMATLALTGAERIWGLDSNSGADWTAQRDRSFGLENRSSGVRGSDPVSVRTVLINELDDSPDLIELRNADNSGVELEGWYFLASPGQGSNHVRITPFPEPTTIAAGGYLVVGDGTAPPPELPLLVPFVGLGSLSSPQGLPWTTGEYDCALYDQHGRLVDLVRTTGHDDQVVHNHPRAPSHWAEFTGAAGRNAAGDRAVGRVSLADSDTGADFAALSTRTMGSANVISPANPVGLGSILDVRVNATGTGGGLALIINAGIAQQSARWSFFASAVRMQGQGPFFGLAADAYQNWLVLGTTPPWYGYLDFQGSARVDLAPGTVPTGFGLDTIFILQDSGPSGSLLAWTRVIEYDV